MVHEKTMDVDIKSYENHKGDNTEIKEEVKDHGVVDLSDFTFTKHIENITNASSAKCRQSLRTVETLELNPMMKQLMHLARADRNIVTWCDVKQLWIIKKIENIQRGFTSKINRLENLDFDRQRKGGIYSLERRRCRNYAILACKLIGGISKNIFEYEFRDKDWK